MTNKDYKWIGVVLSDGIVYGIPSDSKQVLKINLKELSLEDILEHSEDTILKIEVEDFL